jgi:hypothetical protein
MSAKHTLTDSQRREICLYKRANPTKIQEEIAEWANDRFRVKVNRTTISRALQQSDRLLSHDIPIPSAKRHKVVKDPATDSALLEWFLRYQHRTTITDALLMEKARQFHRELAPTIEIDFSPGWLAKWKSRNNISLTQRYGEEASVDMEAIASALPHLRELLKEYDPSNIFNMDETGLFYR